MKYSSYVLFYINIVKVIKSKLSDNQKLQCINAFFKQVSGQKLLQTEINLLQELHDYGH